jgi:hypothetical protein
VLKGAAEKYADFVGSGVSEGVTEAFAFHKRLWLAKHPGQPLPRGEERELFTAWSQGGELFTAWSEGNREEGLVWGGGVKGGKKPCTKQWLRN